MSADRPVKLVLHYDGSRFFGWQSQRKVRTVQGVLVELLRKLCGKPLRVTAAGRTDRGVHATGQVVAVRVPARWTPEELRRALNALAPPDLWVAHAAEVAPEFHPRYDAIARTYVYRIGLDEGAWSPFRRRWCWPLGRPLDAGRMLEAARLILGTHPFAAFAKSGQPERGVRCTILSADWRLAEGEGETLEFEITADRFLHHMVRTLVGTLVEIGLGRRPAHEVALLLEGARSVRAAPPAPPQGLVLTRVDYPAHLGRRRRGT